MTVSRVPARPPRDGSGPLRVLSAFTADDYRRRLDRAATDAAAGGFTGVLGLERVVPATLFRPLSEAFPLRRAVKEEQEVRQLAAAAAAAETVYERIVRTHFAGRTEAELAADLAATLLAHGHSSVELTVVGSGPHGADPYHRTGNRAIQFGDAVILDFGGLLGGYTSCISRTVSVGAPDPRVQEVHDTVRRAQQAAFKVLRPGVAYQEVDRAARRVIVESGFGEYIRRPVGHGVGLTSHEPPYLAEGENPDAAGRDVLRNRGRDLPARPVRRPDRGRRRRDWGRGAPTQPDQPRPRRLLTEPEPWVRGTWKETVMYAPNEAPPVAQETGLWCASIRPGSFIHIYLGLAVGIGAGLLALWWQRLQRAGSTPAHPEGGPGSEEA